MATFGRAVSAVTLVVATLTFTPSTAGAVLPPLVVDATYGGVTTTLTPYDGGGAAAADLYRYDTTQSVSYGGALPLPAAVSNLSQVFVVQAAEGLLVFVVNDRANDGTNGSFRADLSGAAGTGAGFVVMDDPGLGDTYTWDDGTGTGSVSQAWAVCCTDGFVFGPLAPGDWHIAITQATGITSVRLVDGGGATDVPPNTNPADGQNVLTLRVHAPTVDAEMHVTKGKKSKIAKKEPKVKTQGDKPTQVLLVGSPELDVNLVDVPSLLFGPEGAEAVGPVDGGEVRDVTGDGVPDLLVRFPTEGAGFVKHSGTQRACVIGTVGGVPLEGCDTVDV